MKTETKATAGFRLAQIKSSYSLFSIGLAISLDSYYRAHGETMLFDKKQFDAHIRVVTLALQGLPQLNAFEAIIAKVLTNKLSGLPLDTGLEGFATRSNDFYDVILELAPQHIN